MAQQLGEELLTWLSRRAGALPEYSSHLLWTEARNLYHLFWEETQKILSFFIKVGWIFTDLVSEDTRKGTVRYSRNKVRLRQECWRGSESG